MQQGKVYPQILFAICFPFINEKSNQPNSLRSDIILARGMKRKRNEERERASEHKLLKIACKLEISLSAFLGLKMHSTVIKLIKETADMTENKIIKTTEFA